MIRSLIKVTAWEKESLHRRLLCALGRVLILFLLLAAIGYELYANQYSLEARIWHWRYGYTTTLGGYEIPVPNHWLMSTLDSTGFTLLNTSPPQRQRDGKLHITAIIEVDVYLLRFREHSKWMDSWLSLQQQRLSGEKVESIEEKTLNFADESVTCIGGKELNAISRGKPGLPQLEVISLDCMSERGLNITFLGEPPDVPSFYAFVSQIRRKS